MTNTAEAREAQIKDLLKSLELKDYQRSQDKSWVLRELGAGLLGLIKPLFAGAIAGGIVIFPIEIALTWVMDLDMNEDEAWLLYFGIAFFFAGWWIAVLAHEGGRDARELRDVLHKIGRIVDL